MKIFYQKTMNCPFCGKEIRNEGKTNYTGLYEDEKFFCPDCKETLFPYRTVKKMFIHRDKVIDLEVSRTGDWNYYIYNMSGRLLLAGHYVGLEHNVYAKDLVECPPQRLLPDFWRITPTGRNFLQPKITKSYSPVFKKRRKSCACVIHLTSSFCYIR